LDFVLFQRYIYLLCCEAFFVRDIYIINKIRNG